MHSHIQNNNKFAILLLVGNFRPNTTILRIEVMERKGEVESVFKELARKKMFLLLRARICTRPIGT